MTDVLCLASASPRRRELLHQIGVAHCVRVPDVDESLHADETPAAYVQRLALAKAAAVFDAIDAPRAASGARLPVLAADTTVVVEGAVLGKPAERADFGRMLRKLSGREHRVLSAVALAHDGGRALRLSISRVRFRELDDAEIERYWQTGEPCDKAGGYAIQGYGAVFVTELVGSYSGVMGLPLHETAGLLIAAGVPLWHARTS